MLLEIIIVTSSLGMLSFLLFRLLSLFGVDKRIFLPIFIMLLMFSGGFLLRLSGNAQLIDLGYYFTEGSHLFGSVLFASALLLGQHKYWRLKKQN